MNHWQRARQWIAAHLIFSLLMTSVAWIPRDAFAWDEKLVTFLRQKGFEAEMQSGSVVVRSPNGTWVSFEFVKVDVQNDHLRIQFPDQRYDGHWIWLPGKETNPETASNSGPQVNLGMVARQACMGGYCQNFEGLNSDNSGYNERVTSLLLQSAFMMTDNMYTNAAVQSNRYIPASPSATNFYNDLNHQIELSKALAQSDSTIQKANYDYAMSVLGTYLKQDQPIGLSAEPYPAAANGKILDQMLAPLHSATIDGDPISAAHAISQLNQEIARRRSLNDGKDDPYSNYVNRELNRKLLDSRRILQGLKFAKPVNFTLRTDALSPKGMRIRDSLNQLLAAEEVVGFACADPAHAKTPECGAFSEHAQELKTLHKVADRLAVSKQELSYEGLIAGLETATGAIGKLVSGFGDGAAARSGAIIQGLGQLANHPIDTAAALYRAIRTLNSVHGIDLVSERIQNFAKKKLDEIMTGDPETIGKMTGALSVEVISFLATGSATSAIGASLKTGQIAAMAVGKATISAAVSLTADASVAAGKLAGSLAIPIKSLAASFPEVSLKMIQREGALESLVSKLPSLSEEAVLSLEEMEQVVPGFPEQVPELLDSAGHNLGNLRPVVNLLREQNLPLTTRRRVIEAFTQNSRVVRLTEDKVVFRYWTEGFNSPRGRWVTSELVENPHADLALPNGGPYQTQKWTIPAGTDVIEGLASPNFGMPGGGGQIYVPNPGVLR